MKKPGRATRTESAMKKGGDIPLNAALDEAVRGFDTGADSRDLAILQEALVRAYVARPEVAFAAVLVDERAGEALAPDEGKIHHGAHHRCASMAADSSAPIWSLCPPELDQLFAQARRAAGGVLMGGSDLPAQIAWPVAWPYNCRSWLLASIEGRDHPVLLIAVAGQVGVEQVGELRASLVALRERLGPRLGGLWEIQALRAELQTVRSENEALSRLNRMQGQFVAVASHEFKTPLTSITAYTDALRQHLNDDAFAHTTEFLGVIRDEAARMLRMANRILDFSRLGFGRRMLDWQVIDLAPLIERCVRSLAPQLADKAQKLECRLPPQLPRIEGDPDLVRQVVLNLLGNALKYTPPGGRITVTVAEDTATVRISIADTGPGIAPDELRRIFQQFYRVGETAEKDGTGLGLTIVRYIVNLHGGHVDVQSKLGHGATFSVLLPKEQYARPGENPLALGDSSEQLTRITRLCLRMVAELLEVREVALLLREGSGDSLVVQAGLGLPSSLVGPDVHLRAGSGVLAEVLCSEGVALPCPGAELPGVAVPEPQSTATDADRYGRSAADWSVAPLLIAGRAVGVVAVGRKSAGRPLDDDDRTLLAILSETTGAALAAVAGPGVTAARAGRVASALQALLRLKRSGIPTATPVALRLIGRTAAKLGLSAAEVKQLQYVAALHDAGMARIDETIVTKPSELTIDERDEIDLHALQGADLLEPLLPTEEMLAIVRHHHERFDGTGYPDGRSADDIPLGSRILLVVDAFFAMIQKRPYREAMPAGEVIREIQRHAGSQFDAEVVRYFVAILREEGCIDGTVVPQPTAPARGPSYGPAGSLT